MAENVVVNTTAKDNTKLYMILGVVAIAGVAMYMMRKKPTDPIAGIPGGGSMRMSDVNIDEVEMDEEFEDEEEFEEEENQTLSSCIRMGAIHGNWVGIQSRSRKVANHIVAGTPITIKNTTQGLDGNYTVIETWIDTNGNVGALDLETNYTPRLTDGPDGKGGLRRDYRFDNEGLICTA